MSLPIDPATGRPIKLTNAGDPNGQTDAAHIVRDRNTLGALGLTDPEGDPEPRAAHHTPPLAGSTGRVRAERPEWHTLPGAPLVVDEAWEDVVQHARKVREADGLVQALERDQAAELRAATAAVSAGQEVPAGVDWAREALVRAAHAAAARQEYSAVRAAYDVIVDAHLKVWVKGLAESLPELQAKAQEAVAALSAVSTWRSTVRAVLNLESHRDEPRSIRNTQYMTEHAKAVTSVQIPEGLTALVTSDDPGVTASWVLQPEQTEQLADGKRRPLQYPVHVRRAMNENDNTVPELAHLEASESFAVTAFTEGDWGQMFHTPADLTRPIPAVVLNQTPVQTDRS